MKDKVNERNEENVIRRQWAIKYGKRFERVKKKKAKNIFRL